jgi:hypothetical protein
MLTGVSKPYNYSGVRDQVQTWLDPGRITMLNDNCEFVKIDRIYRSIVFRSIKSDKECKFTIIPERAIVNPAFTIENWKDSGNVEVLLNGSRTPIRTAREGSTLLIWIPARIDRETSVIIQSVN